MKRTIAILLTLAMLLALAPAALALDGETLVTTQDELLAALADSGCTAVVIEGEIDVDVDTAITLTKPLVLRCTEEYQFTRLTLKEGGSLTVAPGVGVTMQGYGEESSPMIWVNGGALYAAQAEIAANAKFTYSGGVMELPASLSGAEIQYTADSEQSLRDALANETCTDVLIMNSVTLTSDLTLTKPVGMIAGLFTIPEGITLTVAEGALLFLQDDAEFDVRGTITGDGWWSGKGKAYPTDYEELKAALADDSVEDIVIAGKNTVTIPEGENVTLNKIMHLYGTWDDMPPMKLVIASGASLTIAEGGALMTMGPDEEGLSRVDVHGTLTVTDGILQDGTNVAFFPDEGAVLNTPPAQELNLDYSVRTKDSLKRALADENCGLIVVEHTLLDVDEPITLTKDLSVITDGESRFTAIHVVEGGSLTAAAGVHLETEIDFDESGAPVGQALFWVEGGTLDIRQAELAEGFNVFYNSGTLLLPDNLDGLWIDFGVSTEQQLRAALANDQCTFLIVQDRIVLTDDLELTKSVNFSDTGMIVVPEGKTLTVAKDIQILAFNSELVVDGTITGDGWWPGKPGPWEVTSQDELLEALENDGCTEIEIRGSQLVTITQDITLTKDLSFVPEDGQDMFTTMQIASGATLTIADGVTVRMEQLHEDNYRIAAAGFWMDGGTLDGRLGAYEGDCRIFYTGGTVLLPDGAGVEVAVAVSTEEELRAALENDIVTSANTSQDITLTQDITVNKILNVCDGSTLTVPAGVTMTVEAGAAVKTDRGCTFSVQGTVTGAGDWPGKPAAKRGDLNGDGNINMRDLLTLRQFLAGGYGISLPIETADLNRDGSANMRDLLFLRQYLAGGYGITLEDPPEPEQEQNETTPVTP